MMGDRYIPNPHDAQYFPHELGRSDAEERGNPHPYNSPAWHVWNDGFQTAVRKAARTLLSQHKRGGA